MGSVLTSNGCNLSLNAAICGAHIAPALASTSLWCYSRDGVLSASPLCCGHSDTFGLGLMHPCASPGNMCHSLPSFMKPLIKQFGSLWEFDHSALLSKSCLYYGCLTVLLEKGESTSTQLFPWKHSYAFGCF